VRKVLLPGQLGLTWSRKAAAHGVNLASGKAPSVVLSTSPPISVHLAALQVKKKLGIPWIMDLRDPMADVGSFVVRRPIIYSMLESYLFGHADAIIANTDAMLKLWKSRYPKHSEKFHVIWNGFDPEETLTPAPIPPRAFKHLVHVGNIYGGRNPGLILDSIQRLMCCGAVTRDKVRLSLIGTSSDSDIPDIGVLRQLVQDGVVEYVPARIPQDKARLIACQADALVLLHSQSDVTLPAKLFDYIRIGRPVLAYITRNGPAGEMLERSGIRYRSIFPEDSPLEVDAKMMEFLALPSDPVVPSSWFLENFNGRLQTQSLAAIINSLLDPGRLR
jgi:glycosyltransferase involved in cell wall biosynthesis